jgi:hypothetical protein
LLLNMRITVEYRADGEEKIIVVENADANFDSIKVLKLKVGLVASEIGIVIVPPMKHQYIFGMEI